MDQTEDELQHIASWFREQGLGPGASSETQLCFLWRALQQAQGSLSCLTQSLDVQRSQYAAEISEVRKSLEQIRVFTGHKDVLAQEIQDENDHLRDQLRRLVSLQDAQISEVAKMLYNQGLTELIHSSPSEQVAYLLVERASLLETSEAPNSGHLASPGTEGHIPTASAGQTPHKRALRHSQSPWKRLLGLHKNQSKYLLIPAESRHLADQASSVQRECFRLERDLEEGSRRLAMAHNEIRRLSDELELAHNIQRAYEPELDAAKQEVEQLRQEVEQLKKYEMMGLRKAKELNDRLDSEIQCLRSKLRSLEAERSSLQQRGLVKQLRTVLVQTDPNSEPDQVTALQTEVDQLQSALQQQQSGAEEARELNKSLEAEVMQTNEVCRKLQDKLSAQMKRLLKKEGEIEALKLELENRHTVRENNTKGQIVAHRQRDDSFADDPTTTTSIQQPWPSQNNQNSVYEDSADSLSATQDECECLKKEICETLKRLDQERNKYHETKERLRIKLCRAKQKLEDETKWRDERIEDLERELSLCSHSLTKEKEVTINITIENDKLLIERRRLLQQLNEEVHNKKDSSSVSKCRVDFLEMENKKLHNKILDLSNQISSLERSLQNIQSLQLAEELKNTCDLRKMLTLLPAQTSSLLLADFAQTYNLLDGTETEGTSSSQCSSLARSAEMGYLNLNSSQNHSLLNSTDP